MRASARASAWRYCDCYGVSARASASLRQLVCVLADVSAIEGESVC